MTGVPSASACVSCSCSPPPPPVLVAVAAVAYKLHTQCNYSYRRRAVSVQPVLDDRVEQLADYLIDAHATPHLRSVSVPVRSDIIRNARVEILHCR